MCDKDTCNDASCCGECEPWNCLEQQINDALATKEEQLQEYVGEAKDAAAESKASAEASAQSAAESKEFRDEAEVAASTAVAAEGIVVGVANSLQHTADKLEQTADELGTAIAGIAVSSWFYTTVSENQTVIPVPSDKNAVDVQSIYIEGTRQSPFRGFEFDKTAMIITLAEPLPLGLEIEIILGTYNSDNPNDFAHTLASNNGASLVGTSSGYSVQEILNSQSGSFQSGVKLFSPNDLIVDKSVTPNQLYRWDGALPKTVAAASTPASTGGIGLGAWISVGDAALRSELVTPSSGIKVDSTNINIAAQAPSTKDIPLNVFASTMVSLLTFDNIIADGITDTREGVQAAIDACALAGKTLYVPDGVYAFGNFFTQPSNSHIVFGENAWFKLLNNTTWPGLGVIGHFQNTGTNYNDFLNPDGVTIKFVEATNVKTVGMKLDCNNIGGENGITSAWGSNIRHIRPIVKNTVHTNTLLGGRAFQFEGKVNQDIVVTDATILDCSIGCNSQGLAGSTTANTRAITYDGIFMRNVGVPFNIYGQVANPETADARIQSVTVYNATLHNCGAPQAPFAGSLDGGIICGDRGAGLNIYGLRLVNDESYGGISAICRGVLYNTSINDADFTATYISSVVDQTPPGFGSPSLSATNPFVTMRNVRINSNLDYIAKAPNSSVGKHSLRLVVDMTKASITTLFDNNVASDNTLAQLAMVEIEDSVTGLISGYRSFRDMYLAGNNAASCIRRKDAVGNISPVDISGASLSLTANGVQRYTKDGESITVCINVTYPVTSDSRPATIGTLPSSGFSGVNFCGVAPVLNGPTGSLAVVKSGENFIRINTATGGNVTNADLSGRNIAFTLTYMF